MRLFAFLGGLIVLLLVAALVVPPFVDWSVFRDAFEREASRALGQPVKVRGAASARLLPLPKVTFEDVAIGEGADGRPLFAAERFSLNMELAPLLSGDVEIVTVEMVRPRGRITLRKDGTFDWLDRRPGLPLAVAPEDVSVERVSVVDGSLTLIDRGRGANVELVDIDAELSARSITGPWQGEATFVHDAERYRLSGSTGSLRREGETRRMTTRLSLASATWPYDLSLAGPVTVSPEGLGLEGTFRLAPATREIEGFARELANALPVSGEGRVSLSPGALLLPELTFRVGEGDDPYRLTGSAEAVLEGAMRYRLNLEGAQIDVDRLARTEAAASDAASASIAERLTALRDVLARIPRPDLPGEVSLTLPAVAAGDTVVREVEVVARPVGGAQGWELRKLSASLPGRTLLEARGLLGVPVAVPGDDEITGDVTFQGDLLLASRQPSGFARWLAPEVDDAIRRLDRAGFSAKVAIGPEQARFDDLEVRLGDDRLVGTVARLAAGSDGKPRLLADLQGNRLDADTAAAVFRLFAGGDSVVSHELDLRLAVNRAVLDGVEARDVNLVAVHEGGKLALDRLTIGNVSGAAVEARGRIDDPYGRPVGTLDGRVRVERAAPFLAFLSRRVSLPDTLSHFVADPSLLDWTDLTFDLDARSNEGGSTATLAVDGLLGGTTTKATFGFEGEPTKARDARVTLALDASSDEADRLFDQLGLSGLTVAIEGKGTLVARVEGVPSKALDLDATLGTAKAKLVTKGRLAREDELGTTYRGTYELAGENVDPLLAASGIAFPGVGLGTSADLSGDVSVDPARVAMTAKGRLAGGGVDADLRLDREAQPRPALSGRLALDRLDLVALADFVWGGAVDPSVLVTGDDAVPFGTPTLSGMDGALRVTARTAELGLGLLNAASARDFEADLALRDGDLTLENVSTEWLGGRLTGRLAMARIGETGSLGAALKLVGGDIAATGLTDGDRISGRFDLDVAAEAQGRDIKALVDRLAGGGTLRLDARLSGFDAAAFSGVLEAADAVSDERLEAEAPSLLRERLFAGTTPLDVALPFTIAGGTARIGNVAVEKNGTELIVDLRADLRRTTLDGTVRGRFDPKGAAVEGVSPDFRIALGGTFAEPRADLDATALTTFLATRLRERREREFQAQRAAILERQRLARAMRLSRARERAWREERRAAREAEGRRGGPGDLPGEPG